MTASTQGRTLSPQEIAELNEKLSTMRHDINNHMSLILAAVEVMRAKPESVGRMLGTMAEQPGRVTASVKKFSAEFEAALGIRKP